MKSTIIATRTNAHHAFAQKRSKLAHTVQTDSDEVDALVTINMKRSLTETELERLCNLNSTLDKYDVMFQDVPVLATC